MKLRQTTQNTISIRLFALILLILPATSAAQDKIAFTSPRDGNEEIYVMNPDGSNQTRLTNNTTNDFAPSLSPDGSRIAFMGRRDGNDEIYVMNADGSNQTRLTNNPAIDDTPFFSPDGNRIAFTSSRDGNSEVYIMDSDGSNQTRLTNNPAFDRNPSFSPDGSRIAFESNRDLSSSMEIYVMNADGSNQTRLTFFSPANDDLPSFSPDGGRIAFTSTRDGNSEIYVMNADGSNQVRLTNNPATDDSTSFSPSGAKIAFVSERDGNREIYAMDPNGTNLTRLTFTAPFNESSPSWGGQSPGSSPPALSNIAAAPVDENSPAILSGDLSSPNVSHNFTLTVDWGDGSAPQVFNYAAGTTSFTELHVYADDNPTATNSDNYDIGLTLATTGGSDTDSAVVTVNNVAPVLNDLALNPDPATGGSPTTLSGTVSDVGTQDSQTIVIEWGDGTPTTTLSLGAGVTNFNATHTYNTLGNLTIVVDAADDDGGMISGSLNVSIVPPPPPSAPSNLRTDAVGANHVNLSWTDNANNEAGFVIEQCRGNNCNNFVQIGQTSANVTTFQHAGLLNNTQYIHRVRAYNLGGSSAYSNTIKVKTLRR
ncbi:MAG: DPP IV N-terminal domain-containing protein [Pyrinomonadaceae bacterium]